MHGGMVWLDDSIKKLSSSNEILIPEQNDWCFIHDFLHTALENSKSHESLQADFVTANHFLYLSSSSAVRSDL